MEWTSTLPLLAAGAYLVVNVIAMLMFLVDKLKAKKGSQRISEKNLLTVALFGPFGAWAGMRAFHHKTRKPLFKLMVPLFAILHLVILFLLVY
jgi:uncharacterized membrane protein YsdA (DUF1294 family)